MISTAKRENLVTSTLRTLRCYVPFARGNMQTLLSYGTNFFMFVLGGFLRVVVGYYLWQAIYASQTHATVAGFTFTEMAFYLLMSELTGRMVQNDADWIVSNEIKTGSISMNLIKPISYHSYVLANSLGQFVFEFLFVCLPVWLTVSAGLLIFAGLLPVAPAALGLYLLSVLLSFLIMFFFNLSFGFIAFWLQNIWGVGHVKYAIIVFLSGGLFPLTLFPEWVRNILAFTPFASLNYVPISIYLGKVEGWDILRSLGTQVFWLGIFALISFLVYRQAIKRLTVQGG